MFEFPVSTAPFHYCFEQGASGINMEELLNVPVIEIGIPGNGREVKWSHNSDIRSPVHSPHLQTRTLQTILHTYLHRIRRNVVSVNLLLDLGTNITWLNCRDIKSLSSLRLVTCESSTCKSISGNGCDGKICLYREPSPFLLTNHTVTKTDRVVQDKATLFSTESGIPPSLVSFRPFTFSCAVQKNLQGLAPPISGVIGLSSAELPFWRQVTSAFNVIPKFALCLPSSSVGTFYMGATSSFNTPLFGGNNPIPMTMTPLKIESGKYLISVTSIYVDGIP
ncbi:hypothetical protein Bca52824_056069 [Brassica carinata]|uniref:Xylanase inhibitor N-terminal domain-containing protein n=1 Tax=Brassica carinata TaxID=52824 RepID=A0A8X7QN70_BRACI|nr:hypothetical protein Bca52824_056069 [Brassica carinata]